VNLEFMQSVLPLYAAALLLTLRISLAGASPLERPSRRGAAGWLSGFFPSFSYAFMLKKSLP
jgi:hypothetical protein